jgi:hypothetical protein
MHQIVHFSFYEFYENISWKVFNEAMYTQEYVYLLIFPIRVFIREMWKMWYILNVFLLIYPTCLSEFFIVYQEWKPLFSHYIFEGLEVYTPHIFLTGGFGGVLI